MPPKVKVESSGLTLKKLYLIAYNAVSCGLWAGVLAKVLTIAPAEGVESGKVFDGTAEYVRMVQSVAVLEVLHSLFGIVRAPVFTTAMQIASRMFLVWAIGYNFPQTTRDSPAYTYMLIAWSITEVIRYSYFVFNLAGTGVPGALTWLRYNTFLILYPVGVATETWLIHRAIPPASKINANYAHIMYGVIATYIPGFYTLFTYMLKQRKRILSKKE